MKYVTTIFLLTVFNLSYGAETLRDCQSKRSGKEAVDCMLELNKAINSAIANEIEIIKTEFLNKEQIDEIIATQQYWESYARTECRSRMIKNAQGYSNGVNFQTCMYKKADLRLKELKNWHNCYDNGCPERKPKPEVNQPLKRDAVNGAA